MPLAFDQSKNHETAESKSSRYRSDIDGLRAVAVIAVILYHFKLGAPGGFVGVDIFFVISGYLITSLLLKEEGKLDLLDFWERRIRRIFPVLALVTIATLLAGALLLLPADFKELGQSVLAQPLFSSNFYFWSHTNYFDGASVAKPLLHTWSLAVEEQFYLLFPLLLLLFARTRTRRRFLQVALILVLRSRLFSVSMAFSIIHEQLSTCCLPEAGN